MFFVNDSLLAYIVLNAHLGIIRRWGLSGARTMSALGVAVFRGASGRAYPFHAISLDAKTKNIGAVYALTKRTKGDGGKDFHRIFYIGQTSKLAEAIANHRKSPRVAQLNGNCVCIHLEKSEEQRKKKIADIRQYYSQKK